jgi:undecaprenyl-diphosphatase
MTLSSIGFHEIKAEVDRPRPEGALASASGSSFPSGHATHSVLYVWLAVTIVLRLRPGMARGAAFVAGGIVLTVLVGLSRVYLNVHYLSDVSGGWALGAAAFSLCGVVGLVISQVRQNPQQ